MQTKMEKIEDSFNNNYTTYEYQGNDGTREKKHHGNTNGYQNKSSQYDEVVAQLFNKQFSLINQGKWKLPNPDTMLSHSKWEVIYIIEFHFDTCIVYLYVHKLIKYIPINKSMLCKRPNVHWHMKIKVIMCNNLYHHLLITQYLTILCFIFLYCFGNLKMS